MRPGLIAGAVPILPEFSPNGKGLAGKISALPALPQGAEKVLQQAAALRLQHPAVHTGVVVERLAEQVQNGAAAARLALPGPEIDLGDPGLVFGSPDEYQVGVAACL